MSNNVLVFVEHAEGKAKKASLAGITFGQQVAAKTGGELHLAVVGNNARTAADDVAGYGAAKVHLVDNDALENYTTEGYTEALVAVVKKAGATVIAAAASSTTKDFLPRLAGRLDAAMASDVLEVLDGPTFKRPMWAGNVIATIELTTDVKVCTARGTEFETPSKGNAAAAVEAVEVSIDPSAHKTQFVGLKEVKSERPDLTTADAVVSGGRGVKGPEGFGLVEQLADLLKAGVGASRAACDAGWVANDLQVGQTGKVVAPDLYIAVGISGAIQHLAGMKGSKVIVAINKDPEAPIFQVADYGLVDDLFKAVPAIVEEIRKVQA